MIGTGARWEAIFPGAETPARLPPYGWSGERYWHAPGAGAAARSNGARHHPLVDDAFQSALVPQARHHDLAISLEDQPFLRDHQVGGQPIFPATGYLEAALACAVNGDGAAALEDKALRLGDVEFRQALGLSETVAQSVQIALRPRGRDLGHEFEIYSRRASGNGAPWTGHARGTLDTVSRSASPAWPELPEPNEDALDALLHYASVQRRDVRYGAHFQTLEEAWRLGSNEVLARLGEGLGDPKFHVDPTLLDGALQTLYLAIESAPEDADRLLPARMREVFVIPGRRPRWVRTSVTRTEDGATATADMWLWDDEGQPSAMLRGVEFQRAERAGAVGELIYSQRWQEIEQTAPEAAPEPAPDPPPNRWLLFGDAGGVAERWLAHWMRDNPEHRCLLVGSGEAAGHGHGPETVRVTGSPAADAETIVARCAEMCGADDTLGILHLANLDARFEAASEGAAGRLQALRDEQLLGMVRLTRALEARPEALPARLRTWVVTSGAMAIGSSRQRIHVGQAPMWGLVPSLRVEHPRLHPMLVDIDPDDTPDASASHLAEVIAAPSVGEDRLAFRAGKRWAPRLQHAADDGPGVSAEPVAVAREVPFRAGMPRPGVLERLRLQGTRRRRCAPGEVEIQVHASGLNFHDVFVAMGILEPDHGDLESSLGLECAGVVSAVGEGVTHLEVGQPVVAVARGCLGTYAVTNAHLACPKPDALSFEEAAAVPLIFLTADYALNEHARLAADESVLIHAGSGGVGFAAIQLARGIGARIFSTASEAKRDYVRGLGVDDVYDSRSLGFAEEVLAATEGRGVDVVLNSLAGEFLRKSLEVLAPYGRFVEIGKADLVSNGQLGLGHFEDNRSFVAVDIARRCQDRPEEVGRRLADLMRRFGAGELRVPPIERFALDQVAEAFAHMAEAKHRGKIVLAADPTSNHVHLEQTRTEIRDDATYVVIGGGGVGGALIDRLQARGARHIAVLGRSRPANLESGDPESGDPGPADGITRIQADVGHAEQLAAAFARIRREMPPIAGVVHAAGSTADAALVSLSAEQVDAVCRPKMEGLFHLQQAVAGLSLDFLVLCSSATWFLGSHGQANYGAANAFVEAMAQAWRRRGIPATVLHFGPWSEVGIVARAGNEVADRLTDRGLPPMPTQHAVAATEDLVRRDVTSAAVMAFEAGRWLSGVRPDDRSRFFEDLLAESEKEAPAAAAEQSSARLDLGGSDGDRIRALEAFLVEQLRRCLRLPASRAPEPAVPMRRLGLDSLMALELSLRIEEALEHPVAAGVLLEDGMSISRLATSLSDSLAVQS